MKTRNKILLATGLVLAAGAATLHLTDKNYIYTALLYNFPDIDDNRIFPERVIPASPKPQPWPVAADFNKKPLSEELRKSLEETKSVAFLVIQNDSVRYEQYWDRYGPESRSNSFSVAKSIVSTLIGIAIKDGHIKNVDEPVANYLPEFRKNGKQNITIRHLLMMSSGLDWDESYNNPLSVTTEAYYGTDVKKLIDRLRPEEEPGLRFSYKSGDTEILGYVVEAATKKSLSQYAAERLWSRIGAEQPAEWSLDHENGDEKAYCCFFSNARDFARLGQLYLKKGVWNGDTLLPANYVFEATRAHGLSDAATGKPTDFYGWQWWIYPELSGERIVYARGILGQYVATVPSRNLVVVRLGHKRGEKQDNHYNDFRLIMREVLKQYPAPTEASQFKTTIHAQR